MLIYENKSLSPNHVFTFKLSSFKTCILLLIILWLFIKIVNCFNKIGPVWAHKGPYGPIRALWAHMGPNRNKFLLNFDRACSKPFCWRPMWRPLWRPLCRWLVAVFLIRCSVHRPSERNPWRYTVFACPYSDPGRR